MAIFRRYVRPGPGVSKDAVPKRRLVLFFEILARRFFDLIKLNLLFVVPIILDLILIYVLNVYAYNIFIPLTFLPLVLISPFVGGLTYVTRNYAREEHAFLYGDFKDAVKNNWKQFLVHGIITYLFVLFVYVAFTFYQSQLAVSGFFYVPMSICFLAALIFLFMQYYIPIMIVTFDLKLRNIYKNALIFAFAGLFYNLLITLVLVGFVALAMVLLLTSGLTLIIQFILMLLISFSLTSFVINFCVYPKIEKYLLKPYYEGTARQEGEDKNKPLEQEERAKLAVEKSEYVYENGKLVRKHDDTEPIFEDKL